MNNSCHLHLAESIVYKIVAVISSVGLLINILNITIFIKIIQATAKYDSGHMFKYLLFKSIDDLIQFLTLILSPIYYNHTNSKLGSYWYIWLFRYIKSVFELSSSYMQCTATFDCYITIKNFIRCCRTDVFAYSLIIVTHVFCFVFYSFWIMAFEMSDGAANVKRTSFYFSEMKYFLIIHGVLEEFIPIFVLICLNFLILMTIKQSIRNKRKYHVNPSKFLE